MTPNLENELENYRNNISSMIASPGEIPELKGIDIYGVSIPCKDDIIGGDHIIYIDFNKRFNPDKRIEITTDLTVKENLRELKNKGGILLADSSGHDMTDSLTSAKYHNPFIMGISYELKLHGKVTTELFEELNIRLFRSSGFPTDFQKSLTMIYGEIDENGIFEFISAGGLPPVFFSSIENKIIKVNKKPFENSFPVGYVLPREHIDNREEDILFQHKEPYETNQINLKSNGDIVILYTDGLSDHTNEDQLYFPGELEKILQNNKHLPAKEIATRIKDSILSFSKREDDISYVLIKKE
jgi:serine phosphatase RsbU (regulator of sigma subunit)